jgi:hypothetical protein
MNIPPQDSYMCLYFLDENSKPYQPTSRWCANAQFAVTEFLHSKEKSKFVPDEILVTKREFIRDNF